MMKGQLDKRRKLYKKILIVLFLLFFVLVIVLLYSHNKSVYYKEHFLPNTQVNGVEVSGMEVTEAVKELENHARDYKLSVVGKDGTTGTINGNDVDLKLETSAVDKMSEVIKKQKNQQWFKDKGVNEYKIDFTYISNADLVAAMLEKQFVKDDLIDSENAAIVWKDEEKKYVIQPEVIGTRLNMEKTVQAVQEAVAQQLSEVFLEESDCYLYPDIMSDNPELEKQCNNLNIWTSSSITYEFGDEYETVDGSTIHNWIAYDDGNYYLLKDSVMAYVQELAYKYDNFGLTKTFTTSYGDTIEISGGDYGYAIDMESETEALINNIKAGESLSREPEYEYRGIQYSRNGVGDTYIEISIDNQQMFLYVEGELIVSTDVVTGKKNTLDYDTPTGIYAIDSKSDVATLKGQGYSAPVKYWMPFWGNYGIHSASWRDEFGGDIYINNGSHGCVNTPEDAVSIIYDNVETGYPVVVY